MPDATPGRYVAFIGFERSAVGQHLATRGKLMRQRSPRTLQITVLVSATFLEVAANFAANSVQSPAVRSLDRIAPLVVLVLLSVVVVGHIVVHRQTHPAAPRPAWEPQATPYPGLAAFERQDAAVFFGRELSLIHI